MGSCTSEIPAENSYTTTETNSQFLPKWFPAENAHKDISSQFIINEKLGNGQTGSVFTCLYKKTKSVCALKRTSRNDEFSRMQFTTEARVLSKISHPSIIKCIDMLMDDKYYYLILEKCDYDLWQLMSKRKYMSETKIKHIIYHLLSAISHIHEKNLVHRDIKPENIVFTNQSNIPILIDFGDAEMARNDKIYTEFVGTPPYMSPERLTDHNGIALKKSDIWAIGAMTYEMYSGQRCFNGDTQKKVFNKILVGEWNWKLDRMPSNEMKSFVEQCLDLNIETRLSAQDALQHIWFRDIKNNKNESEVDGSTYNFNTNSEVEECEYYMSETTDMNMTVPPLYIGIGLDSASTD